MSRNYYKACVLGDQTMSIRRNKDNSFSTNIENVVSSFARIEFTIDNELEEKYQNWIEECAQTIKACSHTMEETEQFFLQQCDTLPIDKEDYHMKNFRRSVVMTHFQDMLKYKQIEFSKDMTDEEIKKYFKQQRETGRDIKNYSPEHFGIQMSGYYLPHTECNLNLYEEIIQDMQEMVNYHKDINMEKAEQSIYFYFEKTTGHIECNGGGRSLINKIIVFRGVGEEDIKLRNICFQRYLGSMRELGYLPDFRKL